MQRHAGRSSKRFHTDGGGGRHARSSLVAAEDIVYVTSVSWGGMERWLAWFVGPAVWFTLTAASQRLDLFCSG